MKVQRRFAVNIIIIINSFIQQTSTMHVPCPSYYVKATGLSTVYKTLPFPWRRLWLRCKYGHLHKSLDSSFDTGDLVQSVIA